MTKRVSVVVASLGRPEELRQLIDGFARQTLAPHRIVLSVTTETDLPANGLPDHVEIVFGGKGAARQRNKGMMLVLDDSDYVAFFDDDYVPSATVIEGIVNFFGANPDVVAAKGYLLADGINSPGIPIEEAQALIHEFEESPPESARIYGDFKGLYGCNMAFRADQIEDRRFDERLPLYSWQEDNDFAARFRDLGRIVGTTAFVGVHRGVKRSRTSGIKFGYSQVANPIYLMQKGTMRWIDGVPLILRNALANHVKSVRPEPWVDRWGRVKGNWLAVRHLVTGKIRPEAILDL